MKKILSVILVIVMAASVMVGPLSAIGSIDSGSLRSGFTSAFTSDELSSATHIIITHWHATDENGTRLESDHEEDIELLVTKEGDSYKVETGQGTVQNHGYTYNTGDKTITFTALTRSGKDNHDKTKVYEAFKGFSIAAGNEATSTDESGHLIINLDDCDGVHLIKANAFYEYKGSVVAGTTDETVFASKDDGTSEQPEKDTQLVYGYPDGVKNEYDEDIGGTPIKKSSEVIASADDSEGLYYLWDQEGTNASEALEEVNKSNNGSSNYEEEDLTQVKIYNAQPGLHTDKTAYVNEEFNDGRTFDLELESWFSGNNLAEVGLVLDASGSMAFISEEPSDDPNSSFHPITVNKDGESLRTAYEDSVFDFSEIDGKEQEVKDDNEEQKVIEDIADGNKTYKFLSDEEVDEILDKNLTDNSANGYSGYNYFIFDGKSGTSEFVPIGYWDGTSTFPQLDKLIGYYPFQKNGLVAPSDKAKAESNGERDWLINAVTVKEDGSATYATVIEESQNISSSYSFENTVSNDKIIKDKGGWPNYKKVHMDGTYGLSIDTAGGVVLDAAPKSGSFTLAFKLSSDKNGNNNGNNNGKNEAIYIGPLTGNGSTNYLHGYKNSSSSKDFTVEAKTGGTQYLKGSNAFENNKSHYVTIVFDGEELRCYYDGHLYEKETTVNEASTAQSDNIRIVLNGLKDNIKVEHSTGGQSCQNYIDDVYVFDAALTDSEVGLLYENYQTKSNTDGKVWEDSSDYCFSVDGSAVTTVLNNPGTDNDGAGWYYATSASQYYTDILGLGTAKEYLGIAKNNNKYYYYYYPVKEGEFGATFQDYENANKPQTAFVYKPKNNASIRFFIDSESRLCCFYCSGNSKDDERHGWSYVYEKSDGGQIKIEALQHALGMFVSSLNEASPSSQLAAVRFSLEEQQDAETANDKIKKGDLDKLVLLDWTDDPISAIQTLNRSMGDGEPADYEENDDGTIEQYNYFLTGKTSTQTGLESFSENLVDKLNNDEDAKAAHKFLIIFTDGKDTDLDASHTSNDELNEKIKESEAYKLAEKLRNPTENGKSGENSEDGYTIFTVMLEGGPVEKGAQDYNTAVRFLAALAGEPDWESVTEENGNLSKQPKNPDDGVESYDESQYFNHVYASKDADGLAEIFADEIVGEIKDSLDEYNVQDYIDPRFNIVDADKNVWELNENGSVTIKKADASTIRFTLSSSSTEAQNGDPVDGGTYSSVKIKLTNDPEYADEGDEATLKYDVAKNLYYLVWENQSIPGSHQSASEIPVWNARVTVQAKEDFIGGNAVLTNGNAENENYVYQESDGTKSSGTTDASGKRDEDGKGFTDYPSKGFPRTTVNVKIPNLEIEGGRQVIFMGEELTKNDVAQKLGQTIIDKWNYNDNAAEVLAAQIDADLKEDSETDSNSHWYWEYLKRYAEAHIDSEYKSFSEIVQKIVESTTDNPVTFDYFYLPMANETTTNGGGEYEPNQTGAQNHTQDKLGTLKFTWENIEDNGYASYPEGITTDTMPRQSKLSVTYTPISEGRQDANNGGNNGGNNSGEENGNDNHVITDEPYKWDETYKPGVGDEQKTPLSDDDTYTTYIVSGDIVFDVKIPENVKKYLDDHVKQPITFTADLKRNSSEKIGTFTATYTPSGTTMVSEIADTVVQATFKPEDSYADSYSKYGLPIGTYTIDNIKASTSDETVLDFITFDEVKVDSSYVKECANRYNTNVSKIKAQDYVNPEISEPIEKDISEFTANSSVDKSSILLGLNESVQSSLDSRFGYAYVTVGLTDYPPVDTGLTLTKKVVYSDGVTPMPTTDKFSFTITLTAPDKSSGMDESNLYLQLDTFPVWEIAGEPSGEMTNNNPFANILINNSKLEDSKIEYKFDSETSPRTLTIQVELGTDESINIKGMPIGTKYQITENIDSDLEYTSSIDPNSGVVQTENDTILVTATNTSTTPPPGNLTVSKTVTGSAGDTTKDWHFTVTLSDTSINGTYRDMTFVNGVAEFTLKHGESKAANDLPAGVTYTVIETEANQDGYTTTATSDTGTIPPNDETAEAQFTNDKPGGNLSVTKTVTGAGDITKEWHFTVTLSDTSINGTYGDMTFVNGVAEFTLKHGESKAANNLPAGVTYIVTEQEANKNDYITTMTGDTGVILENSEAKAEFTNDKPAPGTGSLSISKTVTGSAGDKNKSWTFTIQVLFAHGDYPAVLQDANGIIIPDIQMVGFDESGNTTVNLIDGQTLTIFGLPVNALYIVREQEANQDGYTTTATSGTGIIPPNGETAEAQFTNDKPGGNLSVTKTVIGAGDITKEWHFTVTLSDASIHGTYGDMTFTNGVVEFTLKSGESKTATGLPAGITYTVIETEANQDGYITTATGDIGTIQDGQTAIVQFTNDKQPDEPTPPPTPVTGSLTVSKIVTGEAGDTTKDWHFIVTLSDTSITGTYGYMTFTSGVAEFTLKHGEIKTATGLPAGVGYNVTEQEANKNDYTTTMTGDTGVILENSEAKAEFTNDKPAPSTGSLSISKTVTGSAGDKNKSWTFTIQVLFAHGDYPAMLQDANGIIIPDIQMIGFDESGNTTVNLIDGQTLTIFGLPVNALYIVREQEANQDGYTTTAIGDIGVITDGTDGVTALAAFTNQKDDTSPPIPTTGSLTVSKTVTGSGDTTKDWHFIVTLSDTSINGTYGDMTFVNGVAEFTLRHFESKTANDLPAGVTYTVTETEANTDGYTTSSVGETGTITEEIPTEAKFINDKPVPEKGSLTVSKTVTGSGDMTKDWHFTVILSDTSINGTYGDMTFVNGVAEFTLKHNESKMATGLPAGIRYTVTEAESGQDGYMTTATGDIGTIQDGQTSTVQFMNDKQPDEPTPPPEPVTGSLTLTKTVTSGDMIKPFTFTISFTNFSADLSSITVSGGNYTSAVWNQNVLTVWLSSGQSVTITGIPYGTVYTIIESDNAGYQVYPAGATGTITAEMPNATASFVNVMPYTPAPNPPSPPTIPDTTTEVEVVPSTEDDESEIIIVEDLNPEDVENTENPEDSNPKTGITLAVISMIAAATIAVIHRKH